MIQLGCNYSRPLLSLWSQGRVHIDWIKLSRQDTLAHEVAECQSVQRALIHTLRHAGMRPEEFAAIDWDFLNHALQVSGSPHIAIHLFSREDDWDGPAAPEQVLDRIVHQIKEARVRLNVPLLLENVYARPGNKTLPLSMLPETICRVLERTGTDLLLDTSHLRCAAWYLGVDPYDYALALPLDKVREIHVAGPRLDPETGMRDRHQELLEEDYALLSWLLERTSPGILTLEYGGTGPIFERPEMNDPEALERQLHRLKGMLG